MTHSNYPKRSIDATFRKQSIDHNKSINKGETHITSSLWHRLANSHINCYKWLTRMTALAYPGLFRSWQGSGKIEVFIQEEEHGKR